MWFQIGDMLSLLVQQLWSSTRQSVAEHSQVRPMRGLSDCPSYINRQMSLNKGGSTDKLMTQSLGPLFSTSELSNRKPAFKFCQLGHQCAESCNLNLGTHCAGTSSYLHYTKIMSSIPQNTVFSHCAASPWLFFLCQTTSLLRVSKMLQAPSRPSTKVKWVNKWVGFFLRKN